VTALPRLRQVALVATDRAAVEQALQTAFGWSDPFHDPAVAEFGLDNAVFAVGDTFVEVVSPVEPGTTAGRYLERRGGDSGYMAIFQVPDIAAARRRVAGAGIRTVWVADLADMAATHLHPRDVPGAIVSLDWADPPGSWRWAGPDWTARVPVHEPGGIQGLTIEVEDPAGAAERWALALGVSFSATGGGALIRLEGAEQVLRFVPAGSGRGEGISKVHLRIGTGLASTAPPSVVIGGVELSAGR
jgi:hypothetical protein